MTGKWLQRCGWTFRVALAAAIVGCSAFLAAPTGEADAAAGDRALKLFNIHTQVTETIVFKRNGRYDPAGLKELNYFLRDWRRDLPTNMDPHLFDLIWQVYQESGSRDFIHVVCGYRSPPTNAMLRGRSRTTGVAEHSQHMLGKAMDFFIPDVPLAKLREIGLRMQIGGVGFYPTSGSPFVHMDTGNVRHWPRMTREQLVRVFPNGRTLHVPSDGRPLPGYEEALADYRARKASGGTIMMASSGGQKSWFSRLIGKSDEGQDEDGIPDAKAADASARAADSQDGAPAPQPAVQVAAPSGLVAEAYVPMPRPSPSRSAEPVAVADVGDEIDGTLPPTPRPSPTARPMVTLASADSIPLPRAKKAISDQLAMLDAKSEAEAAQADNEIPLPKPRSAADAIAAQLGRPRTSSDSPVLAYAAPLSDDSGVPHIDADSGALVGGHPAAGMQNAALALDANGAWNDPLAQLTPISYDTATLELVTRSGSTRQKGYADFRMPQPFAGSSLFTAPEGTVNLTFGRIAYEGLRTDRFAGPFVRQLQTQQFASVSTDYRQTASIGH